MAPLRLGFGVGGRSEAGGIVLETPARLNPGESFRFVFVTDGTTTATSTNIGDSNSFVNTQAGGAAYNGSAITWSAIASTAAVGAIDMDEGTRRVTITPTWNRAGFACWRKV